VLYYLYRSSGTRVPDASRTTRNGIVQGYQEVLPQTSTKRNGFLIQSLGGTKMAKVTYRGVSYDTNARKERPVTTKVVTETYRGVDHDEKVEVRK